MVVNSVLGFLPWCSSNGVIFRPVCIVNRKTRNALFTLSVMPIPSSRFAIIRFLSVCIALSTAPFPVCIRGVQYSFSMFRILQNSRYSFDINAPPLSDFIFSAIPYRLNLLVKKFITSFVSLIYKFLRSALNLSTAISIFFSPCKCLLCNFLVISI